MCFRSQLPGEHFVGPLIATPIVLTLTRENLAYTPPKPDFVEDTERLHR